MAKPLVEALKQGGVNVKLNTSCQRIENEGDLARAVETDQGTIPADLIISAVGVRPRIKLAQEAGLVIGDHGGVKVDSFMRTSDSNIFAVGDCVEYQHGVLDRPALVPLAGSSKPSWSHSGNIGRGWNMRADA